MEEGRKEGGKGVCLLKPSHIFTSHLFLHRCLCLRSCFFQYEGILFGVKGDRLRPKVGSTPSKEDGRSGYIH